MSDYVQDSTNGNLLHSIIDNLKSNDALNKNEKMISTNLIMDHVQCFTRDKSDLGFCSKVQHEIEVKKDAKPQQIYHRLPLGLEERVEAEVKHLLERGIIRESDSPWNSPIVVVKKPNSNDLRICINYKKLNSVTIKPTYYIPDANQIFDSLHGSRYFSTLDLSNAYYQCAVKEEHKKYTAFSTKHGKYEFQKLPFGLCGAPFTFSKLMGLVLKEENWRICVSYLDDVLIFSSTFEEHVQNVKTVLTKIKEAGLKLSPTKCHFFQKEVKFLGHLVSENGLLTDPMKVNKIKNWELPKTIADLRKFLGFCNYYRKFIKNYSEISATLEGMLSNIDKNKSEKQIVIEWKEASKNCFFMLKERLCNPPVLSFPKLDSEFILDTDASFDGIGAVLSQIQDNEERVISYASRKLNKHERSYCITRKELLAVYHFVTYFKQYLLGRKFRIRTDHKALTWLMKCDNPKTTQFCTWISELEIYNFDIEYRKGDKHLNADFLSRLEDCEQCEVKHENPKKVEMLKLTVSLE